MYFGVGSDLKYKIKNSLTETIKFLAFSLEKQKPENNCNKLNYMSWGKQFFSYLKKLLNHAMVEITLQLYYMNYKVIFDKIVY